ncbi:MAG: hypothetical protein ACMXYG_04425 [Candidatus Woesearchaeota archaeon]
MPPSYALQRPEEQVSQQKGYLRQLQPSIDDKIIGNVIADQNTGLVNSLSQRFNNQLPSYDDFKTQFQEAYMHRNVSNLLKEKQQLTERPDLQKLPDMIEQVADKAGYSSRQLRRLREQNQYIDNIVTALKPETPFTFTDVQDKSGIVKNILDYRSIKNQYLAEDPFQRKLDLIVNNTKPSDGINLKDVANTLRQQDISTQLQSAPLQAQLYERMDIILDEETDMKHAYARAKKEYLKLVAYQAEFDESKMKYILGKQDSTTTASRIFERAGLDLEQVREEFTQETTENFSQQKRENEKQLEIQKAQEDKKRLEELQVRAQDNNIIPFTRI